MLNGEITADGMTVTNEGLSSASAEVPLYDKNGEEHYNLISALHKSMRNSDPDAAGLPDVPHAGGGESRISREG